MNIKRRKKSIFLETAATSDLAFLLIIYFLVIAGFNINQGFVMNLPEIGTTRIVQRDELMRFEMDNFGRIFYQGDEIQIAEAEREISNTLERYPNLVVLLIIDGEAPWQDFVYFFEVVDNLPVESFSYNIKEKP